MISVNAALVYLNLCLREVDDDTPLFDDLSERTGMDRKRIQTLLDQLVKEGLVYRTPQIKDGRRWRNLYWVKADRVLEIG